MTGRIETYIHSDSITQNKGGAMVKVVCDTDFAAKVAVFKSFCAAAAKYSFAADSTDWKKVIFVFPRVEEMRLTIQDELKEKVTVEEIVIMKL